MPLFRWPMDRLIQAGLTGGIASGKTTAAATLAALGAHVMDTDELARRALDPGTPAFEAAVRAFGREILKADGTIDRERLGDIVFADARQRQRLNDIVHPEVRAAWQGELIELKRAGWRGVVAVVIPLLYEVGVQDWFDAVIVVGCAEATQRQRLRARGLTEAQAGARIAAQSPLAAKMERADFVAWNECPLAVLEQQMTRIWKRLESLPPAGGNISK
ncbi:MAG: dephospho-CoA kinase [Verrucomicrobia bacterium]|nr:dephospho-CoA kinase [Verrucomicrobiota bacterium]